MLEYLKIKSCILKKSCPYKSRNSYEEMCRGYNSKCHVLSVYKSTYERTPIVIAKDMWKGMSFNVMSYEASYICNFLLKRHSMKKHIFKTPLHCLQMVPIIPFGKILTR